MSDRTTDVDELDARLADFDRRLSAIQEDLVAADDAWPAAVAASPATVTPAVAASPATVTPAVAASPATVTPAAVSGGGGLAGQRATVAEPQIRLLASLRELLDAYEALLAGLSAAGQGPPRRDLVVSAGPFTSTDGLRAFERALSVMPGVREVIVREYAGEDHVIVDVRLDDPTS